MIRRTLLGLLACTLLLLSASAAPAEDYSAVTGGTLRDLRYEAQDGTVVHSVVYIPAARKDGEKLPVLIHFHGYRDTMEMHHGLGELIRTGRIQPGGIVILPQAIQETRNAHFHDKVYQDAVLELAYEMIDKYNGDPDRMSVSGHSDGGKAAYEIVNRHPGVFAACAPVSCAGTFEEGIKRTHLWVFHGSKDIRVKLGSGIRVARRCQDAGCSAMYYVYPNKGHEIQTMVWEDSFPDENGVEVKLIDWLMRQELEK